MSNSLFPLELSSSRAKRLERVRRGAESLRLWLLDRIEAGVATHDREAVNVMAARLVDAQAPGLAREVRRLNEIAASGAGWEEKALDQLGMLFLACEALERFGDQPPAFQVEFLQWLGFAIQKKDLPEEGRLVDVWHVAAQRMWIEDKVTVQKSWLYGASSELWWVNYSYRVNNMPFDPNFALGSAYWAEVGFYPGALQLRGAVVVMDPEPRFFAPPPGKSIAALQSEFADLVAKFPWVDAVGGGVVVQGLMREGDTWHAGSLDGAKMRLKTPEDRGWVVASVSGGGPCVLYGEWDGREFLPTSMTVREEFTIL